MKSQQISGNWNELLKSHTAKYTMGGPFGRTRLIRVNVIGYCTVFAHLAN